MTPAYYRWLLKKREWCLYCRPAIVAKHITRKRLGWTLVWTVKTEDPADAIRALTECF